jgi:hypothetical protein
MGGKIKYLIILVKNLLKSVSVVNIPIHDENAIQAVMLESIFCRYAQVIENTKTSCSI